VGTSCTLILATAHCLPSTFAGLSSRVVQLVLKPVPGLHVVLPSSRQTFINTLSRRRVRCLVNKPYNPTQTITTYERRKDMKNDYCLLLERCLRIQYEPREATERSKSVLWALFSQYLAHTQTHLDASDLPQLCSLGDSQCQLISPMSCFILHHHHSQST